MFPTVLARSDILIYSYDIKCMEPCVIPFLWMLFIDSRCKTSSAKIDRRNDNGDLHVTYYDTAFHYTTRVLLLLALWINIKRHCELSEHWLNYKNVRIIFENKSFYLSGKMLLFHCSNAVQMILQTMWNALNGPWVKNKFSMNAYIHVRGLNFWCN